MLTAIQDCRGWHRMCTRGRFAANGKEKKGSGAMDQHLMAADFPLKLPAGQQHDVGM